MLDRRQLLGNVAGTLLTPRAAVALPFIAFPFLPDVAEAANTPLSGLSL